MAPQSPAPKRGFIYALVAVGFLGLLGAHEIRAMSPEPAADVYDVAAFIATALGTLAFVVAGVLAIRLLRSGR